MSAKKDIKKVLIIEPDAENALRLSHQLEFIDYEPRALSSPELVETMGNVVDYQAVLVANFHGIVEWAERLKANHEACPPMVL